MAFVLAACGSGGGSASNKPLSIVIAGAGPTILPAGSFDLRASVLNDTSGQGVTWSSTDSGLSAETSSAAHYMAPGTIPANPKVTITATSVADGTVSASVTFTIASPAESACEQQPKLRGNESALTAPIAFLVKGSDFFFEGRYVYIGSFTGDGAGNITAAAVDNANVYGAAEALAVDTSSSSYSYGADGRGCLYLAFLADDAVKKHPATAHRFSGVSRGQGSKRSFTPMRKGPNARAGVAARTTEDSADSRSLVLAFVMSSPTGAGRVVEFDSDGEEDGSVVSAGLMHGQTAADFAVSNLASHYAFGVDGWSQEVSPNVLRVAIAGSFANAKGALSLGTSDQNVGGVPSGKVTGGAGTLDATIDVATGRGTGSYSTGGDEGFDFDFVYYVLNDSDILIMSSDAPEQSGFLLSGRALKSAASSAPLDGYYIFGYSGFGCAPCSNARGVNTAAVGTLHATTALAASGTLYSNQTGDLETTPYSGSYTLDAATGRVVLTALNIAPIAYLTSTAQDDDIVAFLVDTDLYASAGFIASQTTSPPSYSDATFAGNYAFGSSEDVAGQSGGESGQYAVDGEGLYSGTVDMAFFEDDLSPGTPVSGTYAVSPDGSGSFDDGAVAFVTNGNLTLAVDSHSGQPLLYVFIAQPDDAAKADKPAAHVVATAAPQSWANHRRKGRPQ